MPRLSRLAPCLGLIRRKRETNESKGYRLPEEIKEGREENKERGKRKKKFIIYFLKL
jgi:hypothetical protein